MPTPLELVVDAADARLAEGVSRDQAAVALTALALLALSDEVVTSAERQALVGALARHWGIVITLEAVGPLLEQAAAWQRDLLLKQIEECCRSWPNRQARELMLALEEVAAGDGQLAAREHALLRRLGAALGALGERPPGPGPGREPAVLARVPGREGETLRVGRSMKAEVCLTRAPIAPFQLRLTFTGGKLVFQNLGSTSAATIRGRSVHEGTLLPGEELSLARYRLRLAADASHLLVVYPGFATVLEAQDLATAVWQDGRARLLIDGVTFRARAGEMVAVIGPSGCGKSTLLHLLRGDLPPARGQATLDGVKLLPGAQSSIRRISFVPQDELLLTALTVEESLWYVARLKGLDSDGQRGLAGLLVDEMLDRVGLSSPEIRRTQIGDSVKRGISGGQRRRVSVAQELVGDDTDVLLLDEPTSGLDPRSEAGITALMRDLADSGKVVICATHAVHADSLRPYDAVLCLERGGRPAYFGPPDGLLAHFQARDISEIFERLESSSRPSTSAEAAAAAAPAAPRGSDGAEGLRPLGLLRQLGILLRREAKLRTRDVASLILALALPLAVAGLCSLVYFRDCVQPSLLFVLCLASVWAGVSFTVRDIIAQFPVLRHESRTRAALLSSYVGKAIIATAASAIQALILTTAILWLLGAHAVGRFAGWRGIMDHASLVNPWLMFLVLWACHLFGNAVGFLLSACFRTAEAAVFMIPFVLLPMVAFAGALVPPKELPQALRPVMKATPLYQGFSGLLGSVANVCSFAPQDPGAGWCSAEQRSVAAPEGSSDRTAFTQSEGSCRHNTYRFMSDFCRDPQLPCPADPTGDPITQLNRPLVLVSVAELVGLALLLHLSALRVCQRRMRTM